MKFFADNSKEYKYLRDSVKVSEFDDFASQVLDVPFSFYKEKNIGHIIYNIMLDLLDVNKMKKMNKSSYWMAYN